MSSGMSHMYIYLIEHERERTVSSSRCAQDIFPQSIIILKKEKKKKRELKISMRKVF